jgi:hypothetical protein
MSSDRFIYRQALQSQRDYDPFIQKQVAYILDSNAGNYTGGQIQLDTSNFANNGKWVDYSEGFFVVPLVITLTATSANAQVAGIQNLQSAFSLGLKNSYLNIFHSFSVDAQNTNVIQQTAFSNIHAIFRCLSKWSVQDVSKTGSQVGFFPDGSVSCRYFGTSTGLSQLGHGSVNNYDLPVWPTDVYSFADVTSQANMGFYQRQLKTTALTPSTAPVSSFLTESHAGYVGQNYFTTSTDTKIWYVTAIIRLRDLHDFFQQLVPTRGLFLKFQINLNQASHNLQVVTNGGFRDVSIVNQTLTSNGTTPLMIASGSTGQGFAEIAQACGTIGNGTYSFTAAVNVGQNKSLGFANPSLTGVRLYAPLYTMNPVAEEEYLSLTPTKDIVYKDIQFYSFPITVSSGSATVNQLISNGVIGLKSLLVVPIIGASSNPTGATGANLISPVQSLFASEPATTSPYIQFYNTNVQVSGVNVFSSNQLYDFDTFINELRAAHSLNGGIPDVLNSGLISYDDFERNYRYFYADLGRRISGEARVPKSINFQTTLLTGSTITNVDLFCFVEYERTIKISLIDGVISA